MRAAFITIVLAAGSVRAFAEAAVPEKWSSERYEETVSSSPFILETPKDDEPPPPPKEDPLFIKAIFAAEEKPYVVLERPGETDRIRLTLGEKDEKSGITLTNIKMGDRFTTTQVEILDGGKKRLIDFNKSEGTTVVRPPGGAVPPPGTGNRGIRPPSNAPASITPTLNNQPAAAQPATGINIPRPPNSPIVTVPRPGGSTAVPSFRGGAPGQGTRSGGNDPVSGQQRVRVRSINNR